MPKPPAFASHLKKAPEETTVVVGMSGGVDSSVTALLLKQQGYRVIGLFMKNWEELDENGVCTAEKDYQDVVRVCEAIDIPYYSVEFVKEYRDQVFARFLAEYEAGLTPNPDILCNREIKFDVFLKHALALGADALATGHYCQIGDYGGAPALLRAADPSKDQTYFLYAVRDQVLSQVLFPIGHLLKRELREIADRHGLSTARKKDSTGICFIGERDFREFLSRYLPAKSGEFKRLSGETVGEHHGSSFYTLGQRRGLGLGGEGDAWYVVGKDPKKNVVYVERGDDHPALYSDYLIADEVTWISGVAPELDQFQCTAKARYRQKDRAVSVKRLDDGKLRVEFLAPERAITPGQSVVFYDGDRCMGGARILSVGPSYYEQQKKLNNSESSLSIAAH